MIRGIIFQYLITILMIISMIYYVHKFIIWFNIYNHDQPYYPIQDIIDFNTSPRIQCEYILLYSTNTLSTIFIVAMLRTFIVLGQHESIIAYDEPSEAPPPPQEDEDVVPTQRGASSLLKQSTVLSTYSINEINLQIENDELTTDLINTINSKDS
jgi:hypothetical protein